MAAPSPKLPARKALRKASLLPTTTATSAHSAGRRFHRRSPLSRLSLTSPRPKLPDSTSPNPSASIHLLQLCRTPWETSSPSQAASTPVNVGVASHFERASPIFLDAVI